MQQNILTPDKKLINLSLYVIIYIELQPLKTIRFLDHPA